MAALKRRRAPTSTLLHLVGDMAELVKALGKQGDHRRPRLGRRSPGMPPLAARSVSAVCAMSVPTAAGLHRHPDALAKLGINDSTCSISRSPACRAELQKDIRARCAALLHRERRSRRRQEGFGRLPDGTLLGNTAEPTLPAWLRKRTSTTTRRNSRAPGSAAASTGIANLGAIGSWADGAASRSASRRCSSPARRTACCAFRGAAQLDAYPKTLPGLRGCHLLEARATAQQEAAEVNRLLIGFRGLTAPCHPSERVPPVSRSLGLGLGMTLRSLLLFELERAPFMQ